MPFGGGAGDVVKALELIKWIVDNCVLEGRTADKKYAEFFDAVESLQKVLASIDLKDLELVHPVYQDITGGFRKTLEACKEFLEEHKKPKRGILAGFKTNVIWALYTNDDVAGLRDKLQFHVRTLNLLVTTQIAQDVNELIERNRSPGAGPVAPLQDPVPVWLAKEFQTKITIAPPFTFTTLEDIPLGKGCSALLSHFERLSEETRKDVSKDNLNLEYLCLLKCYWLIKVLKNGKEFSSRPVGSPARRFISNVEVAVYQRLQNRILQALIVATDDELRGLGSDSQAFHIWEIPIVELERLPWEPKEDEEKILTVALTKGEKLVFLRKTKDLTVMILVPIIETAGETRRSHTHKEIKLNTKSDKFIPRYTIPKLLVGDKLVAEIYQQNYPGVEKYAFDNMEAACQAQRAITGYQVSRDEDDVDWTIQRPLSKFSTEENMSGRAHIWEWNPLTEEIPVASPSTYAPSIAESQITVILRQTELPKGQGIHRQLHPPVPPALVLFGLEGRKPTYVHLDMTPDLTIDPEACHCHETNGQCRLMVVVHRGKKNFNIRRATADNGSLERLDMSLLRGPIHPDKYKNSRKYISCANLSLVFQTWQKRAEFQKALLASIQAYDEAEVEYERLRMEEIRLANRPQRSNSGYPRAGSFSTQTFNQMRSPA